MEPATTQSSTRTVCVPSPSPGLSRRWLDELFAELGHYLAVRRRLSADLSTDEWILNRLATFADRDDVEYLDTNLVMRWLEGLPSARLGTGATHFRVSPPICRTVARDAPQARGTAPGIGAWSRSTCASTYSWWIQSRCDHRACADTAIGRGLEAFFPTCEGQCPSDCGARCNLAHLRQQSGWREPKLLLRPTVGRASTIFVALSRCVPF